MLTYPTRALAAVRRHARFALPSAALGLAVACGGGTLTEASSLSGITVAVTPSRAAVAPGDTVAFTVSIANTTDARAQVGTQCGPPVDVVVTPPQGSAVSVLAGLLGANGAFTCELGQQHFVEARETRTSVLQWRAPAALGTYDARAGLRRDDALGNLSAIVRVVVQ